VVHQVLLVMQVVTVLLVIQDFQETLALTDLEQIMAQQVHLETQVRQEIQVQQVLEEHWGNQAHQVTQV